MKYNLRYDWNTLIKSSLRDSVISDTPLDYTFNRLKLLFIHECSRLKWRLKGE